MLPVKEFSVKKMSSRSNTIDGKFLGAAVEALWERAQKGVRGKNARPDAVIHVDGNPVPKDLKPYMKEATWNKIRFNYTGPDPLEHEHESKIVKRILKNAKDLHKVLYILSIVENVLNLGSLPYHELCGIVLSGFYTIKPENLDIVIKYPEIMRIDINLFDN